MYGVVKAIKQVRCTCTLKNLNKYLSIYQFKNSYISLVPFLYNYKL